MNSPRIAWFTPLRPVESGISLYNEELLPILAAAWAIDVYVDGYRPIHLSETGSLRVRPAREFRAVQCRRPYDAVVYQMGNSPAHAYMYETALEFPGVLVLHDTLLHHLIMAMLLKGRRVREYRALMERRYGSAGLEVAGRVLKGQVPASLFDFPLSEEIIDASRAVIVHSQASLDQVRSWSPGVSAYRVPMGIPIPAAIEQGAARRVLGLPEDQFILASVTHVNPYKRLDIVLRALRRLREDVPAHLLIAGTVSPLVPLQRMVALLGLEDAVDILGFVDDAQARLIVAAADVCVNLRYPTAGETSASLLRIMGSGRPVMVSDVGSFRELPDDAAIKVPVDALEEEMVLGLLRALSADATLRDTIGRNAREFVRREHSLAAMAAGYHQVLEQTLRQWLPEPPRREVAEALDLPDGQEIAPEDPLITAVATAMVDLGLRGDQRLQRNTAEALSEVGLGVGTIGGNPELMGQADERRRLVTSEQTKPISDELLEILACPVCKTAVRLEEQRLVCTSCGRRYRIEDGIPIMLVDEAELPKH
ncbi:glycosyltransferase [Nitrolancea hollandica]|nr:glycosyltransferase [Nitrolancea hollandica]